MSRHMFTFNSRNFLKRVGTQKTTREYHDRQAIYSQGDAADAMFYIQAGNVKIEIASRRGKKAVIAILGPGDVFGEGCLGNRPLRISTASAIQTSTIARVSKGVLVRLIHQEPAFAKPFDLLHDFSHGRASKRISWIDSSISARNVWPGFSCCLTQFWQGKWRRNSVSQNQSGTLGPNGRHHPVAGQSFHEQVQEAGLCRLPWQWRVDGPSRSPRRRPPQPAFRSNPRSSPSAPDGCSPRINRGEQFRPNT